MKRVAIIAEVEPMSKSQVKPIVKVQIASSPCYQKKSKLAQLTSMIKGTAGPIKSQPQSQLKDE